MNIGKRIQSLRREHKMSQEALAEQIGVTRQTISKWELGQSEPDLASLLRLSEIFDVTADDLLGNEKPPVTEAVPPAAAPEKREMLPRRTFRWTAYFLFLIAALCMAGSIFLYTAEEHLTVSVLYYNVREFLPVLGVLFTVWGVELLCVRKNLVWNLLWSAWIVVGGTGLFLIFAASSPHLGRQVYISHLMNSTGYWVGSILCGVALAAASIIAHQRQKKRESAALSHGEEVERDA